MNPVDEFILKTYRKRIWTPFLTAIRDYRLIAPGDRIAVCISGGKDSMLLAKLLQLLQPHSKIPFSLEFLAMDPGYSPANRRQLLVNAERLGIPVKLFESEIFESVSLAGRSPCYLCARMRRGHLYKYAASLQCNKIALGHHFNDVIETTVLAMFYGSQLQAMPPMLHSTNFPGMDLIRPLYCVHEEDICAWRDANQLTFLQCACRMTEETEGDREERSKRREIKLLLRNLRKVHPDVEKCIFHSLHSVHLDTFPGYKTEGKHHSFLERFFSGDALPECKDS